MKTILTVIGSLIIVISSVFAVYHFNEKHDARASDFRTFMAEVKYTFESDILAKKQERLWQLEDRCSSNCTDAERHEIRCLKEEIEGLKNSVKIWQMEQRKR